MMKYSMLMYFSKVMTMRNEKSNLSDRFDINHQNNDAINMGENFPEVKTCKVQTTGMLVAS